MSEVKKVLFVCLGNICRSPIAEAAFVNLVKERGLEGKWEVDSAATAGWHVGSLPDERATLILKRHNIPYHNTARQVDKDDFLEYDFILGMDENNIASLQKEAESVNGSKAKIELLGAYDPKGVKIVRDPYYDVGENGFEKCFEHCMRCCIEFLDKHP